jgi:hypothetical protein
VAEITSTVTFLVFSLLTTNLTGSVRDISSQSSDSEKPVKFSVEFRVPKDFRLEQSFNPGIALMRHEKEELALFVDKSTNDFARPLCLFVARQFAPFCGPFHNS